MSDIRGGCNFMPCPEVCLNCPFPECHNSRPTVKGEMSIEKYVDMVDGIRDNPVERIFTSYMRRMR